MKVRFCNPQKKAVIGNSHVLTKQKVGELPTELFLDLNFWSIGKYMKENNNTGTGNSRIKKSHLYFLKSNYIWFKKHFFNESKEREPEKMSDIGKVRTFWEAHLIWKNLWRKSADLSKPWGIFFFKFCVFLRKFELYILRSFLNLDFTVFPKKQVNFVVGFSKKLYS